MRNYELTVIISSEINNEEAEHILQNIASSIQKQEGIISKQEFLGKRKIPSSIRKQNEGYLAAIAYTAQPENVREIEKTIKEESRILRAMLMHKPIKAKKAPTLASKSPVKITEKERVEIADIDKKLEEIFSE